jgi:hypothetical protein
LCSGNRFCPVETSWYNTEGRLSHFRSHHLLFAIAFVRQFGRTSLRTENRERTNPEILGSGKRGVLSKLHIGLWSGAQHVVRCCIGLYMWRGFGTAACVPMCALSSQCNGSAQKKIGSVSPKSSVVTLSILR